MMDSAGIAKRFALTGEVAVVTGGGTGIGFAIAHALCQAGASVVIVGRREDVLKDAVARLGSRSSYERHDVRDLDGASALVNRIGERVGPPGILVNNAGMHLKKLAGDTSDAEVAAILVANVGAAFALTRAALPAMLARRSGVVLFVASMAALVGIPSVVAYSAAKSALLGVVRTLAVEYGPVGIRVNAIAPGFIESDMMHAAMDEPRKQRVLSRTPLARFGNADEIAGAALYLSSPAGAFVTGVCLPIDGGFAIGF